MPGSQQDSHFDLASWLHGRHYSQIEERIAVLEAWRLKWEGYAATVLLCLRRLVIVLAVWGLAAVTSALPGTPLGALAGHLSRLLMPD